MTCNMGAKNIVTWDIFISQIRHVALRKISIRGMRHSHFLKPICDFGDPMKGPIEETGPDTPAYSDCQQGWTTEALTCVTGGLGKMDGGEAVLVVDLPY